MIYNSKRKLVLVFCISSAFLCLLIFVNDNQVITSEPSSHELEGNNERILDAEC
jgi:hypothetical protein